MQGSNPGLLHCRQILYCPSHQESPVVIYTLQENIHKKSFIRNYFIRINIHAHEYILAGSQHSNTFNPFTPPQKTSKSICMYQVNNKDIILSHHSQHSSVAFGLDVRIREIWKVVAIMEINKGYPNQKQAKTIYSRTAIAKESTTIFHLCWLRLKGRQRKVL